MNNWKTPKITIKVKKTNPELALKKYKAKLKKGEKHLRDLLLGKRD